MRVQFNSGEWTDEEHQGFLRGLEVYGRGSWEAIGVVVPTRSPLQIEEHARQHYAGGGSVHHQQEEVSVARAGETHPSSSSAASSASSTPSRNDGGGGGGSGGGGGQGSNDSESPIVAHLLDDVSVTPEQEELYTNSGIGVATTDGTAASAGATLSGLRTPEQQQQHHQPGDPIGSLMTHEIPYPNPLVWEEPALGEELRRYFGVTDYCGVL